MRLNGQEGEFPSRLLRNNGNRTINDVDGYEQMVSMTTVANGQTIVFTP
jgi:hypothetical protein